RSKDGAGRARLARLVPAAAHATARRARRPRRSRSAPRATHRRPWTPTRRARPGRQWSRRGRVNPRPPPRNPPGPPPPPPPRRRPPLAVQVHLPVDGVPAPRGRQDRRDPRRPVQPRVPDAPALHHQLAFHLIPHQQAALLAFGRHVQPLRLVDLTDPPRVPIR